jgi:hypothetical protein
MAALVSTSWVICGDRGRELTELLAALAHSRELLQNLLIDTARRPRRIA